MELNWTVFAIIAVFLVALLIYLIRRNLKDKKEVTRYFNKENNPEKKTNDHDETSEI